MSLRRGDTFIEILFALSVFSLVAIVAINLMNNGVSTAQASLENTMVRNELNAQAEALRFIHGTVTAGSSDSNYKEAWNEIKTAAAENNSDTMKDFRYPPDTIDPKENPDDSMTCATYYKDGRNNIRAKNAFVLNTRKLRGENADLVYRSNKLDNVFQKAGNYARVIYNKENDVSLDTDNSETQKIAGAEGIWIIGVPSQDRISDKIPQYYDFYIQSCWYNPGKDTPTTIGTVVRLYNPAGGTE